MLSRLFKKKRDADEQARQLCQALLPVREAVAKLVTEIEGPFREHYEAGLFVGILALLELERHRSAGLAELRGAFVAHWIIAIGDGAEDTDRRLNALFFERYPHYRAIADDVDPSPVQWALALTAHCGGGSLDARLVRWMTAGSRVNRLVGQIGQTAAEAARA